MGKVVVSAKIENPLDLFHASRGQLPSADVRTVDVEDALVDTGATGFSVPRSLIEQLGLKATRSRTVRTANGVVAVQMFEAVQLTIRDRQCAIDVTEIADDCPVLIGQIALESLDFVVDLPNRRLIGNPEHGGEHMMEMF